MAKRKKVKKTIDDFYANLVFINKVLKQNKHEFNRYVWGIDISLSNPAVSIYEIGKPTSGIKKIAKYMSHYSHKFKGTQYERIFKIEKSFRDLVAKFPPCLVVIEGYAYSSSQWRELMGEVSYAVKRNFIKSGIHINGTPEAYPCLIVPPTSLKKFVTGKAMKVDKEEMHGTIQSWGFDTSNNDESDSAGLCLIGLNIMNLSIIDIRKINQIKFFKDGPFPKELSHQWDALKNIVMNDGGNIQRFFVEN